MNKFPPCGIDLRWHTDALGKETYNMTLSVSLAKSARQYIIDKGIAADRLIAKGYGETELKNDCGNDAKCSDEQHAVNRRTEFKVLKM